MLVLWRGNGWDVSVVDNMLLKFPPFFPGFSLYFLAVKDNDSFSWPTIGPNMRCIAQICWPIHFLGRPYLQNVLQKITVLLVGLADFIFGLICINMNKLSISACIL